MKVGRRVLENSPPFLLPGVRPPTAYPTTDNDMIHFVPVLLKEICAQGKNYPWQRPSACLRCNYYQVWGHGFVPRYFHGFASCLYLKCYRCPNCGCVMTLRPDTHFHRIRSCKEIIRIALSKRLSEGRWPPSFLPSARMRYWLFNLKRHALAFLTNTWRQGLLSAFDCLVAMGIVPVSRSR
jgi:hypothetical protein